MIDFDRIRTHRLESHPYHWAEVGQLYSPADAVALAAGYPHDHFKLISGYGGEKDYEYEARNLIGMAAVTPSYPERLSPAWQALASDLVSGTYRQSMSTLTGLDLSEAPMEVNVFHYGPGASLGAHCDLPDKVATHVLYFNESWDRASGGCLSILRSKNEADLFSEVLPTVGNSAVIVRSDRSWHAVSKVVGHSRQSRRSVTVTFYRAGSKSSMWPPDDRTPLHDYVPPARLT